nr:MAG TPA: hypothetical protein [Caudoviricetes sp.]
MLIAAPSSVLACLCASEACLSVLEVSWKATRLSLTAARCLFDVASSVNSSTGMPSVSAIFIASTSLGSRSPASIRRSTVMCILSPFASSRRRISSCDQPAFCLNWTRFCPKMFDSAICRSYRQHNMCSTPYVFKYISNMNYLVTSIWVNVLTQDAIVCKTI